MTATLTYTLGRFVWRELLTRDVEAAKRFYGALFGWTFEDRAMGPDFVYTIVKTGDKQIGGLMHVDAMPGDTSAIPPHWGSLVSVENVDAAAQRAKDEGGQVLGDCHELSGVGRFAAIRDPQGAVLTLFRSEIGDPEDVKPATHEFCWENLSSKDPAQSIAFYQKVVGWGTTPMGESTTVFTRLSHGAPEGLASMGPASEEAPPAWTPFVAVDDIVATSAKVRELGGQVFVERTEIPTVGAFGVIQDPTGAVIFLFEYPAA